jgi:surface polysaccharide O-acyltransferase-like enzyme
MDNKRIVYIDIARALAMLYIIGFWHLKDYLSPDLKETVTFKGSNDITNIMLGAFMFISGTLLSKYRFEKIKDITYFLIKRIKRFYILYFITALLFYISGLIPNIKILTTTILGVSTYILPQPYTLWFISMLFSFYLITPFVGLLSKKYSIDIIYIGLLFYVLLIILNTQLSPIDKRIYYCFPAYFMGIKMGIKGVDKVFSVALLIYYIILYVLFIYLRYKGVSVHYLDLFCGIFIFISICKLLARTLNKRVLHIFYFLSYASMCMYLFHRLIYDYIKCHLADCFSIPLALFALLIVFILSFAIQKSYDYLRKY